MDVEFKFVVDSIWKISDEYEKVIDDNGNVNNFIDKQNLHQFEEFDKVEDSNANDKGIDNDDIQRVTTQSSSFAAVSLPHEEPILVDDIDNNSNTSDDQLSESTTTINPETPYYQFPGTFPSYHVSPKLDKNVLKGSLMNRFRGLFRY